MALTPGRKRRIRRTLIQRQGPWCANCGRGGPLTIDHIMPLSRGGSNRLTNLQLLCPVCNQAKADLPPVLFGVAAL